MSISVWLKPSPTGPSKPSRGSGRDRLTKNYWGTWLPALERRTARHRCHLRSLQGGRKPIRWSQKGGCGIGNQLGRTPTGWYRGWRSIWLGKGGCRFELRGLASRFPWGGAESTCPAEGTRAKRRAQYAREQRCYDKDRTRCAQQIIAGNWREPPASLPMSVQEPFWRDLFETPSVPDSRSLPIIGEMHWELMHPITVDDVMS